MVWSGYQKSEKQCSISYDSFAHSRTQLEARTHKHTHMNTHARMHARTHVHTHKHKRKHTHRNTETQKHIARCFMSLLASQRANKGRYSAHLPPLCRRLHHRRRRGSMAHVRSDKQRRPLVLGEQRQRRAGHRKHC